MAESGVAVQNGGGASVKAFLSAPAVQNRIHELLGKKSQQFTTSLMAALNNIQNLSQCKPETVFSAAITAAALDLPINNNLGFAYIIPYKNKGIYEAQFQLGYKGFIQLAQRSGQYERIAVTEVYEGQLIEQNPLTGNTYDWTKTPGDKTPIVGFVAYFKLVNGFEKEMYMSMAEVIAHAKRFSQSYRAGFGPWKDDFNSMALKTPLKMLLSKFGPMSVQMQEAVLKDQAIIEEDKTVFPDNTLEIEDAIANAQSTEELEQYLQTLTVDERKKVTSNVNNRVKELATAAKLQGEADGKKTNKETGEITEGELSDKDKAEIEADEKKAAEKQAADAFAGKTIVDKKAGK